jgi:hypothetical protein
MHPFIHFKKMTPLFLITLLIVSPGLSTKVRAVSPPPDGGYPGFNTAEGQDALKSLTTGSANTANGWSSLKSNMDTSFNTAVGAGTLLLNTADDNTAVGGAALLLNTSGSDNTAVGTAALVNNKDGSDNNAVGCFALNANVSGSFNNALGRLALQASTGDQNNAFGDEAMFNNTSGSFNTAMGDAALHECVDGNFNVAIGDEAGTSIVHGSHNVAVGAEAGTGLASYVNNCIAIGALGAGPFAVFNNTCFIGSIFNEIVSDPGSQEAVLVDQFNVVGIFNSSRRYKHDIQPMDKTSEMLYGLKPVTFKFNSDWKGTTQFGLIAEEVAEVNSGLVTRGRDGEVSSVHYEQVNMMLLNEFLKEHCKVELQDRRAQEQQKEIDALKAELREQKALIQKVSAQLEVSKFATGRIRGGRPAPRTVLINQ